MAGLLINNTPIAKADDNFSRLACIEILHYYHYKLWAIQNLSEVLKGLLHYLSISKLKQFWEKWSSAYESDCTLQSYTSASPGMQSLRPYPQLPGSEPASKRPPVSCGYQVCECSSRRSRSRTIEPFVSKSNWNQLCESRGHCTSLGTTFHFLYLGNKGLFYIFITPSSYKTLWIYHHHAEGIAVFVSELENMSWLNRCQELI